MKKSYTKNILRMIQTTKSRFFSLFAIVMIGVAFFVGVSSSSTMLAKSVDVYNDTYHLKDFTIYSTYGFSEEDVEEIAALDEVETVESTKFVDVIAVGESFQAIARVHSYQSDQKINSFVLKEGRLPTNEHEVLAEMGGGLTGYGAVGDTVVFQRNDGDLNSFLKDDTFTVVGLIDSPLYLNQSRESSTLSNQAIDTYFYVLDSAFTLEINPELDILTTNGSAYNAFDDAYDTYIENVKDEIEEILKKRQNSEYERLISEAKNTYKEGLQEYEDGRTTYYREIAQAQKEIDDAQQKIASGYESLQSSITTLQNQSNLLQTRESETREQLAQAKQQIADGKQQLVEAQSLLTQLQTSALQLYEGKKEAEKGIEQISQLQNALSQLPSDLMLVYVLTDEEMQDDAAQMDPDWQDHSVQDFLDLLEEKMVSLQETYVFVQSNLDAIEQEVSQFSTEASDRLQAYSFEESELQEKIQEEKAVQELLQTYFYAPPQQEYPAMLVKWMEENELASSVSIMEMYVLTTQNLDKLQMDLADSKQSKESYVQQCIQDRIDQVNTSYANLLSQEQTYEAGVLEFESEIANARQQIQEGWAAIEEARRELQDAQRTLEDSILTFEQEKIEGLQELEDAKQSLQEAKDEIDSLEEGQWTLLTREQHYSSVTFSQTVEQMAAIGRIFPLFFLMVAILVCLTTMSRTVSEQRGEIGVLRALGYSRFQCMMKYLVYAASATILGELVGVVVGNLTFPIIIYETWRLMYNLPNYQIVFDIRLIVLTCIVFLLVMLLTTFFTANEDMRENSASLLRPKAPKLGRKILLERVSFLWNRISFSWKITIRNLFRYKRRFVMTVLGIAGCSALLLTGFGIRDSITTMVSLHYDEIVHYQGYLTLSELTSDEEVNALSSLVGESMLIAGYEGNSYDAKNLERGVRVQVFPDTNSLDDYYTLRTRKTHESLSLGDEGVIIDEKLSELMNVSVGDFFLLEGEDGKQYEVQISGITEFYLYHYCLMTQTYYETVTGKLTASKELLILNDTNETAVRESINDENVESLTWFPDGLESFDRMISSLNLIIWTIIVSSMVLAFVVLGNLMNVNISERSREIATLKVLGFHAKEVQNYIYNENNVLTFLGALVGLPLGKWLHATIMLTVEMDYVMFGRTVQPLSYVFALTLTVLFGFTVDFFMRPHLRKIEMVESLKSVE